MGPAAFAQRSDVYERNDIYLSSQRQPIDIHVGAVYQSYADSTEQELTQLSFPVALFVPVGQRLGVSFLASQATAEGDGVETVSGISDAKLGLSFYQRLGEASAVLSVGINIPVGEREFSAEEFQTAVLLSQHFYAFRVPGFGQGRNVEPGLTVAYPLSESFVVGAAVAYHIRGPFEPLADMEDEYDPGDEILLTGGFDLRLGTNTSFSTDATYTIYDSDTIGEEVAYTAGDKVTVTGQILSLFGFNELRLLARYRSQAKSEIPAATGGDVQELTTIPNQIRLRGTYRQRLGAALTVGLLAQLRMFEESDIFESMSLIDVGLLPEINLTENVGLRTRFVYTTGEIEGFEAGGGLALRF